MTHRLLFRDGPFGPGTSFTDADRIDPHTGQPEKVCTAADNWREWYPEEAGWRLVHEGPDAYPKEHGTWDDGAKQWVVDEAAATQAAEAARLACLSRVELAGEITAKYDVQIAALQGQIKSLAAKVGPAVDPGA
jgi:hypothetical protein